MLPSVVQGFKGSVGTPARSQAVSLLGVSWVLNAVVWVWEAGFDFRSSLGVQHYQCVSRCATARWFPWTSACPHSVSASLLPAGPTCEKEACPSLSHRAKHSGKSSWIGFLLIHGLLHWRAHLDKAPLHIESLIGRDYSAFILYAEARGQHCMSSLAALHLRFTEPGILQYQLHGYQRATELQRSAWTCPTSTRVTGCPAPLGFYTDPQSTLPNEPSPHFPSVFSWLFSFPGLYCQS